MNALVHGFRLAILAVALWALPAGAQTQGQSLQFGDGPVLLFADTVDFDQETRVVTASGSVEISRAGRRLLADRVRYDIGGDLATAEGNVTLIEPNGETLFADDVVLSGDLRDGVLNQLRARLQDDSLFVANGARRVDGNRTELDQAVYSPCEVCRKTDAAPLWQLRADRIIHDQDGQEIIYRDAFFELFGVPVAYTPFFSHPDPTVERKSGFLAPSVSTDSELGLNITQPYYFALDESYDLTLAPIVTANEGVVLTTDYRQLLDRGGFDLFGSATVASGPEASTGDETDPNALRGHLQGTGGYRFNDVWDGGYELFFASDDTYLQRYNFSNRSILDNRLFAERIEGRDFIGLNAYGFQGLREADDQGLIPIVLPLAEAEFSRPWRNGSRLTLDGNAALLTRTAGLDTRRFSVTGGFEQPWLGPIGDRYRFNLSLRGDVYQTDGDPVTLADTGETNVETRVFPRATVDWSWPLVGESFGLTPLIEPLASATITPVGINDEDIPNEDSIDLEFDDTNVFDANRFPGLDVVEDGSHVSYGLRLGLFGSSGELVNALVGQSFRFMGNDSLFDPDSGLQEDLSDYVGRIDFSPTDWLGIRYRFRLDRDSLTLERNEVRGDFGRNPRLDLTFLTLESDPAGDEFVERSEIKAGLLVGLGGGVSVRAQTRRNLETDSFIAHNFGLVYRNPCLLLIAGFERRFTENRDAGETTNLTLRVTFEHLGELGGRSSLASLL